MTTLDYYPHFDNMLSQPRRMSSPYIPAASSQISQYAPSPRRYSVQAEGSPYISHSAGPFSHSQILGAHKTALRTSVSTPLPSLPVASNVIRRDSLRTTAENLQNTSELARYKTELCRPYEETGQCRYGAKCQFAHGAQELRTLNRHPKYKTELCRTFHTTGFCSYGQRCNFIHNDDERRVPSSSGAQQPGNVGKVVPYDFPLSINSTGDSPASSVDGGSPTLSPCYLNDDVFATLRISPTPSYSSDSNSLSSSGHHSPPRSPKSDSDHTSANNGLFSPLDMGLSVALHGLNL